MNVELYLVIPDDTRNIDLDDAKVVACPFCMVSTTSGEVLFRLQNMPDIYFWCTSCGAKSISDGEFRKISQEEVPQCLIPVNYQFVAMKLGFVTKLVNVTNHCLSWFWLNNPENTTKFMHELKVQMRKQKINMIDENSVAKFCTQISQNHNVRPNNNIFIYVDSADMNATLNSYAANDKWSQDWLVIYVTSKRLVAKFSSFNMPWDDKVVPYGDEF